MVIGDGTSTLFWEDPWMDGRPIRETAPNMYALIPKRRRKRRTVQQALAEHSWITDITGALSSVALWQYVQLWTHLQAVQLSVEPDRMVWRWTTDAQYSSRSCYNILFEGSIVSGLWKLNWKSWAPPRVKFFIWLACQDRCWTGARLARRVSRTRQVARCATSPRRLWRTSLPVAPSRGQCGTRCCVGYDRPRDPQ